MSTVIIGGTEKEVKECYELYRQLRPSLTRKLFTEQVLRQIKNDKYKIVCIKKDSKMVACAGFRILETLSWGRALYIDDLITDEMSRNRGHASHLITWLQEEAKRLSCKQIHLDSGFARTNAHRLYLNSGFHIKSLHFNKEV